MKQYWKPIPGYEGLYEVSMAGEVRSVGGIFQGSLRKRPAPRLLSQSEDRGGYRKVILSKNASKKAMFIQRLVLMAFVGPRPEGCDAAHLNGIRTDNRFQNLKWVSRIENIRHRDLHGTTARGDRHGMRIHKGKVAGERNGKARLKRTDVMTIRRLYLSGQKTQAQLAMDFGVKEPAIWKIVNNRAWKEVQHGVSQ